MRSGLESYAAAKLAALRADIKSRDRAVLLGAALSFTPIFPACFFGVIISTLNFALIRRNLTSRREERLVNISLVVGCIYSLLWLYIFILFGDTLGFIIESLEKIIITPLNFLFDNPTTRPAQREFVV